MDKRKIALWALKQAAYAGIVYGASRLAVIGRIQEEERQAAIARAKERHPTASRPGEDFRATARQPVGGYRKVRDNPQA